MDTIKSAARHVDNIVRLIDGALERVPACKGENITYTLEAGGDWRAECDCGKFSVSTEGLDERFPFTYVKFAVARHCAETDVMHNARWYVR